MTQHTQSPVKLPVFSPASDLPSESFGGCARCERVPELPSRVGALYLWFPLGHSRGKAMAAMRAGGHEVAMHRGSGAASVRLDDANREAVLAALADALTANERAASRALLHVGDGQPGFDDIGRVTSFAEFCALDRSTWLIDLLREERFTSWFQPIVEAADTSRIFAQEALLRGRARDGSVISPGAIFEAANDADLLFQVDLAARLSALRGAALLPAGQVLFVNFSPAAIYDPVFCLQRTVKAVDKLGLDHHSVVFEIVESGQAQDPAHLRRVLE